MRLRLEHGPRLDLGLKKKKLLAAISREKTLFPLEKERIELYRQLIMKIYDILSEEEKELFVEDPIEFYSQQFLFRGLDHKKTQELLQDEKMLPQAGQYGSEGVFFSDSPLGAASFMPPDGSLAIINRADAVYLDKEKGIADVNDKEFKKQLHKYIDSLPETERREANYTAVNKWDTAEPYSAGRAWKIIALRQEQPLSSITAMLIPNLEKQKVTSVDPNNKKQRDLLEKKFIGE